ncbi:hypothetical protein [Gayadomonas joobiniege]|uniref:hypothetical protein n=1 Tax=Gayadomonas joobiniege TaxID=1234606 RepID=UPI00037C3F74|nr:hypothetical protein [Gayadomonas joobiniege]
MAARIFTIILSSLLLAACMSSPGYLFGHSQPDSSDTHSSNTDTAAGQVTEQSIIKQQVVEEDLPQIVKQTKHPLVKTCEEKSAEDSFYFLDLICQLSATELESLILYVPQVKHQHSDAKSATLVQQGLIREAKYWGIKVMNKPINAEPVSHLAAELVDTEQAEYLLVNLINYDGHQIQAAERLKLADYKMQSGDRKHRTLTLIGRYLLRD